MSERMKKFAETVQKLDRDKPLNKLCHALTWRFNFEILELLDDPNENPKVAEILKQVYQNNNDKRFRHGVIEKIGQDTIRKKLIQACSEVGINIDFES